VKKDVHRGWAPQEAKEYVEGFDKSPAVRIQLGWSSVNLCQQFPLKPGEGQAHADAFEDHLVEVEERDPVVGTFIHAHRLSQGAREHDDVVIMPLCEGSMIVSGRDLVAMADAMASGVGQSRSQSEQVERTQASPV